jgi:hypothetical protein
MCAGQGRATNRQPIAEAAGPNGMLVIQRQSRESETSLIRLERVIGHVPRCPKGAPGRRFPHATGNLAQLVFLVGGGLVER